MLTLANYMHGTVTSYNAGSGALVVNVLDIGGSGTLNDWNIAITGTQGPQGPSGAGNVSSVFGRTGVVVATSGDYTFSQIGSTPTTISGYGITDGVTLTGTQTLTNKTLTSPVISSPTGLVKADVGLSNVDNTSDATKNSASATLTNKTIDYANNTLTGVSPRTRAINAQTGTTYTFVLGDAGNSCTFANASAVTVTVPPNSSVAFPVGTQIDIAATGAGQVTLAQGSGVTINSEDSKKKLTKQYSGGTLVKTATDTWLLMGSIST